MKNILSYLFAFLLLQASSFAQETSAGKTDTLEEVTVTAFEQNTKSTRNLTSVKVIQSSNGDRYNKTSLVNGFNSVAGVRMEERSPGSYRLNIRGSSLRSPFGVRNVKIYWNNIPVTDPGGNSYFNQFAFNNFSYIEVFKGPSSSMYGAGTGGLLLMHSFENSWRPGASAEYVTGSYGLQNIFTTLRFGSKENRNTLSYAHNQSDGYRDNTKMRRDNVSWSSQIKISDRQELGAYFLFTDMYYQTPGGLTLTEFNKNPKQARPAAGGFPSAQGAKATIYQKTAVAGFTNQYTFNSNFKNTTTIYGSFAQIKNPTFRNYERRNEPSFGGRTSFVFDKKFSNAEMQWVAGGEWQEGYFNTQVSKNNNGNPDTLQTNDDIRYTTYNFFLQGSLTLHKSFIVTAGASINESSVTFSRLNNYPVRKQGRSYQNEWSPRISIIQKIGDRFSVYGSVSKGFSPPTIAELLPSTGAISTFLEAEKGFNYELGTKANLLRNKLHLELTGFYFKLDNALVVRKDSSNADYYINAGNTNQKGVEFSADYITSFNNSNVFKHLLIRSAYTYSHFTYGNFIKNNINYKKKSLPSVPRNTISVLADLIFKPGLYINTTYYYASSIFLDDANAVKVDGYHLLGARVGWQYDTKSNHAFNIYAGADNLLDETYSLGNDINAAGGRYYNAAPKRNYYVGVAWQWKKPS